MRTQLLHLSGPYRGKTTTYGRRRLRIGTAPDVTLRFPQRAHVAKNHAEITFVEAEFDGANGVEGLHAARYLYEKAGFALPTRNDMARCECTQSLKGNNGSIAPCLARSR